MVDGLIDAVEPTGQMDVIADLAYPLPTTVIADLLGLPTADRARFKQWSDDIAAGFFLIVGRETAAAVRRAYESQVALAAYFRELVAERRAHPRDDLLSALVAAEADGAMLSEDELLATCVLLLFAGHETTTNLIGNGVLALLEHADQFERLQQEPALLGSAIEEFLRYDGPVQATARRATVGFELHGTRVNPGDYLLLVLGAANRDPAQFAEPDRLDLGRADHRHLAFSLGPHFCLGAALARLEASVAFESLLRRLPRLRAGPAPPVRRPDFFLRGLASLPVAFGSPDDAHPPRG
jgi:cytochrome P450